MSNHESEYNTKLIQKVFQMWRTFFIFTQIIVMEYQSIQESFLNLYNTNPEVIIQSPGRINLLGEHTDYNDGMVLPAAIDKSIVVALGKSDNQSNWVSYNYNETYTTDIQTFEKNSHHWTSYIKGVVNELLSLGKKIPNFNMVFGGDIPLGAGLSSSAALETGIIAGLNELFSLQLSKLDIIQIAKKAENNFVGVNCGIMDMFANVKSMKDHVLLLDCKTLEFSYFKFDNSKYSIILCNSGVSHQLVNSQYNLRRKSCMDGVALLNSQKTNINSLRDATMEDLLNYKNLFDPITFNRCLYVIEESIRMNLALESLQNNDYQSFGKIMYQTHLGLKNDYEVSCDELDFLVDKAMSFPNTMGSRMMGGGFGGCSINLIEAGYEAAFIQFIDAAYFSNYGKKMEIYPVKITNGLERIA